MIPATNKFSWSRVASLGRYYYPALRTQLIVYPLLSLLAGILLFLSARAFAWSFLSGIMSLALGFMLYFGPIVFAKKQTRAIETMLPATGTEKATFVIGYSLIILPLMIYLPQLIAFSVLYPIFPSNTEFGELIKTSFEINKNFYGLSYFQALVPTVTCLFVIYTKRTNRVTMGCVWAIVAMIVQSIIGGVIGAVYAIKTITDEPMLVKEDFAIEFIDDIFPIMIWFFVVCLIYTATMAYFTAKNIRSKQV